MAKDMMLPERKPLAQMEEELSRVLVAFEDGLDSAEEGSFQPEFDLLKTALVAVREKRDAYAIRVKRWQRESQGLRDLAAELMEQARVADRKVERLRGTVNDIMVQLGTDRLDGVGFSLVRMKNNDGVEIVDADKVTDEYRHPVPEVGEPDKKAILKALKEGKQVDGAKIKPGEFRVDIKVLST